MDSSAHSDIALASPPPPPADIYVYPCNGVSADWTSVPRASLPPAQQPPPPSLQPGQPQTVGNLQDLQRAFANASVSEVVLTSHVRLAGAPLALSGPGRSLRLRGACAQPPPGASAAQLTPGLCALDAASLSRHATVLDGARLELQGIALLRGSAATAGGSVLAMRNASVVASGCLFDGSRALGEGGALLAASGSTIDARASTFRNCSSLRGFGGAAAAAYGSAVLLSGSTVEASSAQSGGCLAAVFGSRVVATASALRLCR